MSRRVRCDAASPRQLDTVRASTARRQSLSCFQHRMVRYNRSFPRFTAEGGAPLPRSAGDAPFPLRPWRRGEGWGGATFPRFTADAPFPRAKLARHVRCAALALSHDWITQYTDVVDLDLHDIAILHVLRVPISAHPEHIAGV